MAISINNIRVTLLADAGSLNVGTTLNMVQNRVKERGAQRVGQENILPPNLGIPEGEPPEKIIEDFNYHVPQAPTV